MASVSGMFARHGGISIDIVGLQEPASSYSSFRTHILHEGIVRSVRKWTYYSSGTSAYFLDDNDTSWHSDNGTPVYVQAWATISGNEYYIGQGNIH